MMISVILRSPRPLTIPLCSLLESYGSHLMVPELNYGASARSADFNISYFFLSRKIQIPDPILTSEVPEEGGGGRPCPGSGVFEHCGTRRFQKRPPSNERGRGSPQLGVNSSVQFS